jgi:hypothetical protein
MALTGGIGSRTFAYLGRNNTKNMHIRTLRVFLLFDCKTQIIRLHDALYTEPLHQYLNRSLTFIAHLTICGLDDKSLFQSALKDTERFDDVFGTAVSDIRVEAISRKPQHRPSRRLLSRSGSVRRILK